MMKKRIETAEERRNRKFRLYTRTLWNYVEDVWEFDSFEEKEETIKTFFHILEHICVTGWAVILDPDDETRAEEIGLKNLGGLWVF